MKKIKNNTKKFKTDEPEIPFTFDFYLIYWEDIQSDSGYNAKLVPTFKVIRVDEDERVVSPADIIQVIDCVGKF